MADINSLEQNLGIRFKDRSILEQSLVHSSYLNENPGLNLVSNQRLEFLGDAVLGLVIAEKLIKDMPDASEGELTELRASLVKGEVLARLASSIKLGDYLSMGKGEDAGGGRTKPANLAGALEALIAAVYLDRGLSAAEVFIIKLFGHEIDQLNIQETGGDYKSRLQELVQARQQITPRYNVVTVTGPAHDRTFTVEVLAGETVLGQGCGKSKKTAETEAARAALAHLPG